MRDKLHIRLWLAFMAQILVRGLEESVKNRLKRRAERHGHSMEEEIRSILRVAAQEPSDQDTELGDRIVARFAGIGLSSDLPEWRGHSINPPDFSK